MTKKHSIKFAALLACAALSTPLVATRADTTTTTTTTVVTRDKSGAPRVRLNGQPLSTAVAPQIRDGVTFVPMRDIFEALGATVVWVPDTQEIRARKGDTNIWLQIGNSKARVGRDERTLREAPILDRGSTLVPLRFVSEALGARVRWHEDTRVVAIWTGDHRGDDDDTRDADNHHDAHHRDGDHHDSDHHDGDHHDMDEHNPPGDRFSNAENTQTDVRGSITVPSGAVIPVTLDQTLSSKDARVGDKFSATVKSGKAGDSEFPSGTKIWGRVSEVRHLAEGSSGVLGLEFTGAQLPDGTRVSLDGDLVSLDDQSVTQNDGRIIAKNNSDTKKGDLKAAGIGAGAGYLLGRVVNGNSAITTILGAGAGYLYSRNKDKGREQEVVVDKGSTLGVRLTRSVQYTDANYYDNRRPYVGTD